MTRTGCRSGGVGWIAGWLKPGDELEIAGRRLEVLRLRIHGSICNPEPCEDSPLTPNDNVADPRQTGAGSRVGVALGDRFGTGVPGTLARVAIPIADESVAPFHAVLVSNGYHRLYRELGRSKDSGSKSGRCGTPRSSPTVNS